MKSVLTGHRNFFKKGGLQIERLLSYEEALARLF